MKVYNYISDNELYEKLSSLIVLIYAFCLIFLSFPAFEKALVKEYTLIGFGIFFTLEYVVKFALCIFGKKSLKWTGSFYGIIDFIAIVSFCLSFVFHYNFLFLRILRIIKVLPVNKNNAISKSLDALVLVIKKRRYDLGASFVLLSVLLVIASCAVYCFEYPEQPEKFSSIVHSFWWAIITMTTVGYGDIYPITLGGKIVASLFAVIGFGFVALPAAIISSGYIQMRTPLTCEKCGHINFEGGEDV